MLYRYIKYCTIDFIASLATFDYTASPGVEHNIRGYLRGSKICFMVWSCSEVTCNEVMVLWMEEILHHLGWLKYVEINGINHLSTGVGFRPSTV